MLNFDTMTNLDEISKNINAVFGVWTFSFSTLFHHCFKTLQMDSVDVELLYHYKFDEFIKN